MARRSGGCTTYPPPFAPLAWPELSDTESAPHELPSRTSLAGDRSGAFAHRSFDSDGGNLFHLEAAARNAGSARAGGIRLSSGHPFAGLVCAATDRHRKAAEFFPRLPAHLARD